MLSQPAQPRSIYMTLMQEKLNIRIHVKTSNHFFNPIMSNREKPYTVERYRLTKKQRIEPAKPKQPVYCEPCDRTLNSERTYRNHLETTTHLENVGPNDGHETRPSNGVNDIVNDNGHVGGNGDQACDPQDHASDPLDLAQSQYMLHVLAKAFRFLISHLGKKVIKKGNVLVKYSTIFIVRCFLCKFYKNTQKDTV